MLENERRGGGGQCRLCVLIQNLNLKNKFLSCLNQAAKNNTYFSTNNIMCSIEDHMSSNLIPTNHFATYFPETTQLDQFCPCQPGEHTSAYKGEVGEVGAT